MHFMFVVKWEEDKALLNKLATWQWCVGIQMSLGEVLHCWGLLWEDQRWCGGFLWSASAHHLPLSGWIEPQTVRVSLCLLIHSEHFSSETGYTVGHLETRSFSVALSNKRAFWRVRRIYSSGQLVKSELKIFLSSKHHTDCWFSTIFSSFSQSWF